MKKLSFLFPVLSVNLFICLTGLSLLVFFVRKWLFVACFVLFSLPVFGAEDVSGITQPLDKIYTALKAIVSVAAVIVVTIAGAKLMFSGDNLPARENAKLMVSYAIFGLVVVWVAPFVVSYLTAPV